MSWRRAIIYIPCPGWSEGPAVERLGPIDHPVGFSHRFALDEWKVDGLPEFHRSCNRLGQFHVANALVKARVSLGTPVDRVDEIGFDRPLVNFVLWDQELL